MCEVWKDIEGYENLYQVSNLGRVKSIPRKINGRIYGGKILHLSKTPYCRVDLCKEGNVKSCLVHRLVAIAFIPNPNKYPCVNHKDENKENNCVENLEWCTYAYNNLYSGVAQKAADARRGKPLSDAHKKSVSETLKKSGKERAEKRRHTMSKRYPYGIRLNDEHKQKISQALIGRKKTEETKAKMCKPKSPQAVENMRKAQRISHKARKLGMTYSEYLMRDENGDCSRNPRMALGGTRIGK